MSVLARTHRIKTSSSSASSSSVSSSSASSIGLKTPEWGAKLDPHFANLDNTVIHIDQQTGKGKARESIAAQEADAKIDESLIRIPEELAAPPPLLLPDSILFPGNNKIFSNVNKLNPPTINSRVPPRPIIENLIDENSDHADSDFFSSSSSGSQTPTDSNMSEKGSHPPPIPPRPENTTTAHLDPSLKNAAPSPREIPTRKRKRGRSNSLHLLWTSELNPQQWKMIKTAYERKTGANTWPNWKLIGVEAWSLLMETAGF